jgi:primosomal protein N' (replication factor Y)
MLDNDPGLTLATPSSPYFPDRSPLDPVNHFEHLPELSLESPESLESLESLESITQWVEVLVDCPVSTDTTKVESEAQEVESEAKEKLFTYKARKDLGVQPGDILSVPFHGRQLGAIAIHLLPNPPAQLDPEKIKSVEEVICRNYFPTHYWELLDQVARYYQTSLLQVMNVALPPGLLSQSQRRIRLKGKIPAQGDMFLSVSAKEILKLLQQQKTSGYSWRHLQKQVKFASRGLRELTKLNWVESYLETPKPPRPQLKKVVTLTRDVNAELPKLTSKQQEVLDILRRSGGELWLAELLQMSLVGSSVVEGLAKKGLVTIEPREVLRTGNTGVRNPDQPKELTPDQAIALEQINRLSGFTQVLLHGVTGSGKTEVYLQAIAPILAQGKSALVLVPEIGLTPQLTSRFQDRFGLRVFVYHSALSHGERYDTWRQMLTGEPQVIIGTRSAIFAPLPQLGMIILDEEHDTSFKQDQPAPCYHARTVAKWRSQLANCPLLLGSATPDLETWAKAQNSGELGGESGESGKSSELSCESREFTSQELSPFLYLALPERINTRPLPQIEIIDMRLEFQAGNKSIFSLALQEAIAQMQKSGQQGILFVPRRGYSTFVSCRSCGYVMECPHCDVSLSYHHIKHPQRESKPVLQCHYCNHQRPQPTQCPECGSPYFKFFGSGTQRVSQELEELCPGLRIMRFDSDTTRTKDAHRILLDRFAQGEADLLVGTQMLTKGIDLAQVTLVGVVAADGLLHRADYRATERTFQTLTQVAGRAGRGDLPGRVLIQTYSPDHAAVMAVQRQDYPSFAATALKERIDLGYPPYGKLVLLRFAGQPGEAVQAAAEAIADYLEDLPDRAFNLLGPAPATILRIADRFHWQILLKFPPQAIPAMPSLKELRSLVKTISSGVSLTIDVEALNLG